MTPTPVTPRLLVPFACAKTPDLVVPPPFEIARIDVAPLQVTVVEAVVGLLTFLCTASGSLFPPATARSGRPPAIPNAPTRPPRAPATSPRLVRDSFMLSAIGKPPVLRAATMAATIETILTRPR